MRTASAKAKGRRCAQEVKELLLNWAPIQPDDIQVTSSGDTGEDLKFSPLARQYFPWVNECKNQEALNIWSALEQAQGHSVQGLPGVVWFRRNRSKLFVALPAADFVRLVRR